MQYVICSTVGQSIASVSDLGKYVSLSASRLGKYDASVAYINYGPPYCTIYITYLIQSMQTPTYAASVHYAIVHFHEYIYFITNSCWYVV